MEVLYKLERTIPFTSSLILEANWRSMWLVRKSTDWPEPSRWHNSFQELSWSPLESTCAVVPFLLPRNELCHRRSGQSWPRFQVAHENLARPRQLQFLVHSTNCTRVQAPDMAATTRKRYAIVINSSRERNRSHQSAEARMNCCNVKFEQNCIGPLTLLNL